MQNLLPMSLGPLVVLAALAGGLEPRTMADEPTSEAKLQPATPTEAEPADIKPAEKPAAARPEKLRFQFRFQPWKDVLDWFAQQADLSLVMDAPPQGTFNYTDTREYTPGEAIDLLNSVLQTKGYTLVRRGRMLMLVNLEDGIPANLVSTVPIESLDKLGESELVSVLYNLEQLKPEEAEAEIRKLLGPQGSVVALARSRQLLVTDTAGRLRSVRSVLRRIEGPEGSASGSVQAAELKFARNEDVLPILRQLLEIPEDKTSAADGSIRIATESGSSRLLISGRAEKVVRAIEIIKGLDVPAPGSEGAGRINGTPQLEVYPITGADPQAVLAVVQALLAGQTDARLALDPKTGSLIAMARPNQHATIRATIAQLQKEGQRVEVIRLVRVDPQTAVLSINKLFASGDPKSPATGPHVDADPASRQLMIRGTAAQISQIRDMLSQMGENLSPAGGASTGGRVRTVPLSGPAARAALDRVQEIWPGMRPNKIRVVSPSARQPGEPGGTAPEEKRPGIEKPAVPNSGAPAAPTPQPTAGRSATLPYGARVVLAAQQLPAKAPAEDKAAAPIVVVPGPNGLTITSEDTEALDEFERLLQMATQADSVGGDISVFYLKNAKAASVAETLDRLFAAGASDAGGSSGKEDEPSGALARAGLSRRPLMTGPVKITPETRLNALLVQANRADLDGIEQVLKILDMKESPEEVSVAPKPRLIPVVHTRAQEVADVVKQVYADRMSQQAGGGQQPQMPFFMRMGGFGGRGGGGDRPPEPQSKRDDSARISIGVDTRTNTLIVAATDAVFEEVKQLVEQLDVAAGDQGQTVQVVTLHRTSAAAVERALMAIAGDSVQMKRSAETPATSQGAPQQPSWQSRWSRGSRSGGYGSPMMQGGAMPGSSSPRQGSQGYQGGGGRRSRSYQSGQGGSPQPGGR